MDLEPKVVDLNTFIAKKDSFTVHVILIEKNKNYIMSKSVVGPLLYVWFCIYHRRKHEN